MKIYETNSGLGYRELAYLLKVEDGYLCIGHSNIKDGECGYRIGFITPDVECLEETNFELKDSPLYDTYLFQKLIKNESGTI